MGRMTVVMCLLTATVLVQGVEAQAPTYRIRTPESTQQSAPNSPWYRLGAQFGYKLAGNDDFADALIASSRLVLREFAFPNQSERVGIPLIGNLSRLNSSLPTDSVGGLVTKLMNTAEGMNLGLYPYVEMLNGGGASQLTFYGSATWKMNAGKDRADSTTFPFHQGRFTAGAALDLFIDKSNEEARLPVSISGEFAVTAFRASDFRRVTGESRSRIVSFELTGILPVRDDVGLLGQFGLPLSDRGSDKSLFRVGFIYIPKRQAETKAPDIDATDNSSTNSASTPLQLAFTTKVVDAQDAPVPGTRIEVVGVFQGSSLSNGSCASNKKIDQTAATTFTTDDKGEVQVAATVQAAENEQICIELSAVDRSTGRTAKLVQALAVPAASGSGAGATRTASLKNIVLQAR